MTQTLIQLDNLKKIFISDEVETHALSDINLQINSGEYLAVAGPSGCGKSTLLSLLGLLDVASDGSYRLSGNEVIELNKQQRASIRNKEIGFVFQSFNLISDLTVAENVQLPLTYRDDINRKDQQSMVDDALQKVDMSHRSNHYPSQLSGGQQQRVAIARAIVGNPSIILADEPTGNLDSKNAEAVMALFEALHKSGATICIVTHDPRSASHAKRRIEMLDGRIVDDTAQPNRESAA